MKRCAHCLKPIGLVEYKRWKNLNSAPGIICVNILRSASRKSGSEASLRGSPGPIKAKPRSGERDQDHGTRNWRPIGCNVPVGLIRSSQRTSCPLGRSRRSHSNERLVLRDCSAADPRTIGRRGGRTVTGSEVSSARDPLSPSPRCIRILINYVAGKR